MHLVFIHGWGFGPDIWAPVLERLDYRMKTTCVDLGFFQPANLLDDIPPRSVIAGHSLGFLWLLKHGLKFSPDAVISISGFDRFTPHVDPRIVRAMKKGVERNVDRQLQSFWDNCGVADYKPASQPDNKRLIEGLDWLETLDGREELAGLDCPKLVLAARGDKIVPEPMSRDIWTGQDILWSETGGHMLPVTRPDWTAQKITEFIDELR